MPWSDVRRISHVCAGGMAIHMTEAVNSASARRNSRSRSSGPGTALVDDGGDNGTAQQSEAGNNSDGEDQEQQPGGKDDSDEGLVESLSMETEDAWTQGDRRTSLTHGEASGSAKWDRDGYEWERVAQASLEYVLGQEFASKYKVIANLTATRGVTFLVWPVSRWRC